MKKWFFISLAALTLSLSVVVGTVRMTQVHAQVQNQETVLEAVEVSAPAVAEAPAEEAPKFCQDEQGQAKECSNEDFLKPLLKALGGEGGLKGAALALAIMQVLLFFLFSPLGEAALPFLKVGMWKLTVGYVLNAAAVCLGLMVNSGVTFGVALVHGSTIAAIMLLGNQVIKQYGKMKLDKAKA
jgi:hypothetical protein